MTSQQLNEKRCRKRANRARHRRQRGHCAPPTGGGYHKHLTPRLPAPKDPPTPQQVMDTVKAKVSAALTRRERRRATRAVNARRAESGR